MSENLDIRARLTATDEASPVIRQLIANIKKLESAAKGFGTSFGNAGRVGMSVMAGFDRTAQNAAAQMRGLGNVADRAAASYRNAWAKADQDREKSVSRMYASQMREERQYQALLAKRSAGTSPRGSNASVGKIAGGTFLGVGAASAVRQLGSSAIAAERNISRGIASAFKERLKISKAETQAEIFGDLSADEVRKLRKTSLDRLGIKFGTGIEGTLNVATELSKAGIGKNVLGDATELALKAKMAIDVSEKETAELFGGLASFIQFDKARYASISNSIAISNKDSKATGTQIVEGMKRGLSALATTGGKLTPEQLAGLVGTAIDVGIQPGKSGNFISHLIGSVGSADTMHGQKAKDMQEAARNLGFGGRNKMAQDMRGNPMESIYKLLDNLAKLPEKMRIKVAKDVSSEQWFDEALQMVLAKEKLKQIEQDVATDKGFLDKAALKAIRSMSGAHASVVAAAKLAQEKIGGGFDKAFTQIANAILRHADTFNFDSIKDHFEALTDGLLQGFGLRDWGQAVDWLVARFDSGTIETWKSWGRGFASGIKAWGESLMSAFSIIKRLTGFGNDSESTGRLVANLTALATSLIVVNPLMLLLAGTMALMASPFVRFVAAVYAVKQALDWVADKMFVAFVSIVDAVKNVAISVINKVRSWIRLAPIGGEGTGGGHGASGSWEPQSEQEKKRKSKANGKSETDDNDNLFHPSRYIGDSIKKLDGNIQRAAFLSYGGGFGGGGIQTAFSGGGGGLPSIMRSTPGAALPSFGVGPSGSIIRRSNGTGSGGQNFGSIPPGGPADMSIGQGLAGSDFLKARRARFEQEIQSDPSLSMHLAAMQATEGASKGGTIESLMNRADMQGKTLRHMLGYSADGRINPKSFYGPIRRGELGPAIERLKRSPKEFAKYDALTSRALAGGHVIGGYTDQGLATDPNGSARTGIPGFKISPKDGNEFTDWAGAGRQKAINFRHFYENGINGDVSKVPSPADAVKNVPALTTPMSGGFDGGGSRGSVAIHINGGQHDPEALATLVQRRVDESMNWRAHDTASEYT